MSKIFIPLSILLLAYFYFQNLNNKNSQVKSEKDEPLVVDEQFESDGPDANNNYRSVIILDEEITPSPTAVYQQYAYPTPTWVDIPTLTPEPIQSTNSYIQQNPWAGYKDKEAYCHYLATKIANEMKVKYPDEIDYDIPAEYRVTYDWDKANEASFQDCMSYQP
ncbi:MAG: hypothetical protein UU78_C0073G0007 [Candidatus Roizmanbacteria bacterium GW2011_GWC2_41_7]|uniref:Uncharacterized protein n=1 Tax=Candidatus Roizmanbacteria bacterium GW2011_GWC2_41_7 TaxID=1618487 RepID=A0A0G0X4A9_9BACT|nr:MAG: hypothetical protein UU78_C0073G0007 [Candidatus Roizmanbacteria bacterium GW2011_GWC2_41_7]